MICYWYDAPTYLFFAPDLPPLLYYSHIPATIIALIVGFFVFFSARHSLLNRLLLMISLCFSAWILINLTAWTNINSDVLIFLWSFYGILQGLISILCIYFIYVFLDPEHKDVSLKVKITFLMLLLPIFVLAPTDINVSGFNLAWCDAFEFEGAYYKLYYTFMGILAMLWILVLLIQRFKTATSEFRRQIILMGIGIESFLFLFFTILYLATELAALGIVDDSRLEMFGLFGMVIFMIMMGIMIVRFRAFNVGIVAANALVVALLILVASQFTYATTTTSIVLTFITLVFTSLVGYVLVKSVRKEIKQREHIEHLAHSLEKANARLKVLDQMKSEFVSIASHQLRSPLTSIRGYASMLLEGSFGKLTQKGQEAVERIAESSRFMALSVEDYLNVSRIEAGRMKYEMSDFNLKEMVEHIVDDVRPTAVKKGLIINFKSANLTGNGMAYGDIGKTQQIIHNLLDNSMKYTPKGTITATVDDNKRKGRIFVEITDTGVGMDNETAGEVFEKFVRARNANKVNVTGTGLGLYVAKQMAEGMGGTITATSPGEGKGSTFTLELPTKK